MRGRNVQQAAIRPHGSAMMVVFGCGAGVKGLSAASRQDGMACRSTLDRDVNEDQYVLTQAVSAIL